MSGGADGASSGGVSVSGGLGSVQAPPDAMRAAGSVLTRTADDLDAVAATCSVGYWALWAAPAPHPAAGTALLQSAQAGLDAARNAVSAAAGDLRTVATRVGVAAGLYETVDRFGGGLFAGIGSALSSIGQALGPAWRGVEQLPDATVTGVAAGLATASPAAAWNAFSAEDPQLLDSIIDGAALDLLASPLLASGLVGVDAFLQAYFQDGSPVVSAAGIDTSIPAGLAPRSLTDLVDGVLWRDEHEQDAAGATKGGEIDVKLLHRPDGTRSVIVDIPGTKDWSARGKNPDVTGLTSNVRAIAGAPTTYEKGVLTALQRAGVRPDEPVMLVGHSLGGMVAVEAARDATRSGRFRITDVVTAGSPIGDTAGAVPSSVQVLALENEADLVPELDGRANPVRRNVLTVRADAPASGGIGGNHSLDHAYESVAEAADHSGDPSVDYYLATAEEFLDADSVSTERFVITREYR